MTLQSIPAAANTIKEMLVDQAAPSQQIDDLISRYLRVRDSSAIDKLEHELTAIFAGGVDHAARIVAGLEVLGHTRAPQQETHVFKNPAGSRIRAAFQNNNRPQRFPGRTGAPVRP